MRRWSIACRSVFEVSLCDLSGGGIRVYSQSHPAARQYAEPAVRLSFRPGDRMNEVMGAALGAHVSVVDDWIPFDRYLGFGPADSGVVVWRGPAFLIRACARAIQHLGVRVSVGRPRLKRSGKRLPKVLHLGESYVVAGEFEVSGGVE